MGVQRAAEVEPFLRGAPWPAIGDIPYPRADPADARQLPADTWSAAQLPAGVRLEFEGDATSIEVDYFCASDDLGYRGRGAGIEFSVWCNGETVDEQPAAVGAHTVRLAVGSGSGPRIVYLPEGMRPVVTGLRGLGGQVVPGPARPRWVAYGDSITEGWSASSPSRSWVAVGARERSLDAVNLGYAGSARGEIASAEQIASMPADIVSIVFGTNCWSMTPHSAEMLGATTSAFLEIVRSGHRGTPLIVVSPIVRPDAEDTPNRLGSTLSDLRGAVEQAVDRARDPDIVLIPGRQLVPIDLLADGIHPGDAGHLLLAHAVGEAVNVALEHGP